MLAPTDYKISVMPNGQLFWEAARSFKTVLERDDIEFHYNEQLVDHLPKDFDTKMIVKINTPWKAFTPKGYSIPDFLNLSFEDLRLYAISLKQYDQLLLLVVPF